MGNPFAVNQTRCTKSKHCHHFLTWLLLRCHLVLSFDRLGRRITLMLCGLIFDIGALLQQLTSSGHVEVIYAGRAMTGMCTPVLILSNCAILTLLLLGLAIRASSFMVPIYISECSPSAIRGPLVGIFEIVLQFSQAVGFWVKYGINHNIPE
jgi:MFS family permease